MAVSDASNYLLNADDPAHIALRLRRPALRRCQVNMSISLSTPKRSAVADGGCHFPDCPRYAGEDGSLQGMLRVANLPFVGSMFWLQQPVWIKMSPNVCYASRAEHCAIYYPDAR